MRSRFLLVLTAGFLVGADVLGDALPGGSRLNAGANAREADPAQQEKTKLQGLWTVVKAKQNGEPADRLIDATLTIAGDRFISDAGGKVLGKGTWKVDPTKDPKTIDVQYSEGSEKGKVAKGIYQLNGSTWIILFSAPGLERPLSFTTEQKDGQTFLILKAAKEP
jgi:uncharacterized protein (TIGR03067 family)